MFSFNKQIDTKSPLYRGEQQVMFLFQARGNGNIVVVDHGRGRGYTFDGYGRPVDGMRMALSNELPVHTEVVTLYPNGGIYVKDTPVRTSSFGVENLIQVRVTRRGDQIIKKELL